jgi:hypothetical protein
VKVFSSGNPYVVEQAQVIKNTEGSYDAIVKGEMADTSPGSQSTACCLRDFSGTWENLCLPLDKGVLITAGTRLEDSALKMIR